MTGPSSSVESLRFDFDRSFAVATRTEVSDVEDLLAVRIAGDAYAIRLRELSGLTTAKHIVPVPSRVPHLLGIAGVRGAIVPVYSLAVLLGYAQSGAPSPLVALVGGTESMALAFQDFEALIRVAVADVHDSEGSQRKHVGHLVRAGAQVRSIVSIPSVMRAIKEEVSHE